MAIELPDLLAYRATYQSEGIEWPLKTVPQVKGGLLTQLPSSAGNKTGWPHNEQVDPELYREKAHWPKLTIVTPSYQQAEFLERTIRSVLLQNYPNLEYIIIDGGSTDGSVAVIQKYAPWLSFWESTRDHGQGHAINKGFSLASGNYYGWINSDDYYLSMAFCKVLSTFQQTRAAFVYGYALNFIEEEKRFGKPSIMEPLLDYFIRIPTLAQPACFWCKSIHQPVWEALHCALDYELWLRMVKGNKRKLIRQPLAVAVQHNEAKTHNPDVKAKWEQDHLLICDESAYGSVPTWNRIIFLYRLRSKIYKWFRLNENDWYNH